MLLRSTTIHENAAYSFAVLSGSRGAFSGEYRDKRNHVQRPLHTADYFVFRSDSAGWEECKPIEKLLQFAQQGSKRNVLDAKGQWRCPPGEAFAATYGLTYRVRASEQINLVIGLNDRTQRLG